MCDTIVSRSGRTTSGKEMIRVGDKKIEALQELLKLIAENPDLAERITITIKPAKLTQGDKPKSK